MTCTVGTARATRQRVPASAPDAASNWNRGEAETERLLGSIDYLLDEVSRWHWLPDTERTRLKEDYHSRRRLLTELPMVQPTVPVYVPGPTVPEPAAELVLPAPPPEPVSRPEETVQALLRARGQAVSPPPWPTEPETIPDDPKPEVHNPLSAFLDENPIRWFHTLGLLMITAACVGVLRSPWAGYAQPVLAILMVLAPFGCFAAADRTRERLPMSSRLLTVLGGLLFPSGLLALNAFLLHLPSAPWATLSFCAASVLLAELTRRTDDTTCLYLTGLCLGLGGLSMQIWVGFGGLIPLAGAVACLVVSRSGLERASMFKTLRQGLVGLALLLSLPALRPGEVQASLLFFLGAAFFLITALMFEDTGSLVASAWLGLSTCLLLTLTGVLPVATAAFGLVAMGTGYLTLARRAPEPMASTAYALGSALTGWALAGVLTFELAVGGLELYQSYTSSHLMQSSVVALLGALAYAAQAGWNRRPGLLYGSAALLAYSYLTAVALVLRSRPETYALALCGLPLVGSLVVAALRRVCPKEYLSPVMEASLAFSLLPGMLALAYQGVAMGSRLSPWVYALSALINLVASLWMRNPTPLYLSLGWTCLAYGFVWPLLPEGQAPPLELYLVPLVFAMGMLAATVDRQSRTFAVPIARVGLALGLGVATLALTHGAGPLPAISLGLLALASAVAAWRFADWTILGVSCARVLSFLAAALVPLAEQTLGLNEAAILLTLAVLVGLGRRWDGVAWGALAVSVPMVLVGGKVGFAFLWLLAAAVLPQPNLALLLVGSHVLLYLGSLHTETVAPWLLVHACITGALCRLRGSESWMIFPWLVSLVGFFSLSSSRDPWSGIAAFVGYDLILVALRVRPWGTVTAVMVLLAAPLAGTEQAIAVYAGYALLAGAWGVRSGDARWVGISGLLAVLAASWFAWSTSLELMPWIWLGAGLGYAYAPVPPTLRAWLRRLGLALLLGASAMAAVHNDMSTWLVMPVAALALWPNSVWTGFVPAYVAYLELLPRVGLSGSILACLPLGLMLVWQGRHRPALQWLGQAFLYGPALLESMGRDPLVPALAALGLGLVSVVAGVGLRSKPLLMGGSLGMLAEIGIRLFSLAILLPWQLVVSVLGASLVGLGVLFERKRVELLAASRRLFERMAE